MNKSTSTIVAGVIAGIQQDFPDAAKVNPAAFAQQFDGNKKWRKLHERFASGFLSLDAFETGVRNKVHSPLHRHRNMTVGKPARTLKLKPTQPKNPRGSSRVSTARDGRLAVPRDLLDKLAANENGAVSVRGKVTKTVKLAADGRLRLSKTLRKDLGITPHDADSYNVVVYDEHIQINL